MRFIMSILSLVLAMCTTPVYAGFQGFNGSEDLKLFNKLQCSTGMTCSKMADKFVMTTVGGLQNQIASTTTALTKAQCGSTIVSNSADVVTLPEASTVLGCRFTFVCGTDDDFDVNPADANDTIGKVVNITGTDSTTVLAPSAGDAIRCTDIGSAITLEAVGADLWVAIGAATGTWTDVD